MSYYASGTGNIMAHSLKDAEKIEEIITHSRIFVDFTFKDVVYVVFEHGNYDEDKVIECLNKILPYCDDLELNFGGEAGSHWKFKRKDGAVEKLNGSIVYNVDELKKDIENIIRLEARCDLTEKIERLFSEHM